MADFLDTCLDIASQVEFYRSEKANLQQLNRTLKEQVDALSSHLIRLSLLREVEHIVDQSAISEDNKNGANDVNQFISNYQLHMLLPRNFNIYLSNEFITSRDLCDKLSKLLFKFTASPVFSSFIVFSACKYVRNNSVDSTNQTISEQKLFIQLLQIFSQSIYSQGVLPDDERQLVKFHCDLSGRILKSSGNFRTPSFIYLSLKELVRNCGQMSLNVFSEQFLMPLGLELLLNLLPFPRNATGSSHFNSVSDSDQYAELQQLFNAQSGVKIDEQKLMAFCHSVSAVIESNVKMLPPCLKSFLGSIEASLKECSLDATARKHFKLQLFLDAVICPQITTLPSRMSGSLQSSESVAAVFASAAQMFRVYAMSHAQSKFDSAPKWIQFNWTELSAGGYEGVAGSSRSPNRDGTNSLKCYAEGMLLSANAVLITPDGLDLLMSSLRDCLPAIPNATESQFTSDVNQLSDVISFYDATGGVAAFMRAARTNGQNSGDYPESSNDRQVHYGASLFALKDYLTIGGSTAENYGSFNGQTKLLGENADTQIVLRFELESFGHQRSLDSHSGVGSRIGSGHGSGGTNAHSSGAGGGGGQASSNDSVGSSESGGGGGSSSKKKRHRDRIAQLSGDQNKGQFMKDAEMKSEFGGSIERKDFDKIENAEISSVTSEKSTKKLLRFDVPAATSSASHQSGGGSSNITVNSVAVVNVTDAMLDFTSEAASVRSACSLDFDQDTDALSDLLLNEQVATRSEGGRSTPRSMITSDDGLLDSATTAVASSSGVNSATLRPPGNTNQRLPPPENITDKFGKFEIDKGPMTKRSARGDIKDMRQNSSQSNASALGGVSSSGAGGDARDIQSDTWSVDAYASEDGSEPPPETTSVERLSEIMEDCELSGSLRATSLDVAVSRSSALSLASVPDDTSNLNVPSSSSNHPSSHGQRLGNRRPSSSSRDERRRSDNMRDEVDRDLDDEREGRGVDLNRSLDDDRDDGHNVDDDDALGAIGGLDTSLLHVAGDDNNSDTWSVDVAASEFELNEEQRLDDFLEEQLLLGVVTDEGHHHVLSSGGKSSHSRRGSRRSKKPSGGSHPHHQHQHSLSSQPGSGGHSNLFLSTNSASNYDDFIATSTIGIEDAVDDLGMTDPTIELAIPQAHQNANLQNDRLTLLMNAEHDVPHSLQTESSLDVNLSSQYSNAGSSVLDSGISGSLRTTLTVSSMSSCLDSAAGGTGTLTSGVGSLTGSSNARASGGARPKTTSSHYYHHHHHFSHSGAIMSGDSAAVVAVGSNMNGGGISGSGNSGRANHLHSHHQPSQQRVTVKSPPIDCLLPKKKPRRIESHSSTHSSPLDRDESLLDHRNSSHWFNEDTASSTGAGGGGGGGQRSRNVSTGGVSSTADLLMQQTASVSNQDINATDDVFMSPQKHRRSSDFHKNKITSEDLSSIGARGPPLSWTADEADSMKGAGRLSQSEVSDRFDYQDSHSLLEEFGVAGVAGAHNSSSASLDVQAPSTNNHHHHLSQGTRPRSTSNVSAMGREDAESLAQFLFSPSGNSACGHSSSASGSGHGELKCCLTTLLLSRSASALLTAALAKSSCNSSNVEKLSEFLTLCCNNLDVNQEIFELTPSAPLHGIGASSLADQMVSPASTNSFLGHTALSLAQNVSDASCAKLVEDLGRDKEKISAQIHHLLQLRRDLNLQLNLASSLLQQVALECVHVQSGIVRGMCDQVMKKFEGEVNCAQQEVLTTDSQEMSKQRQNLENMVVNFMHMAFPELMCESNNVNNNQRSNQHHHQIQQQQQQAGWSVTSIGGGGSVSGVRREVKVLIERRFTENVFIGILFPRGSQSFSRDRVMHSTLSNLAQQLNSEACESLLGLPKKYTRGFPWPLAIRSLALISFQMVCDDIVRCICATVSSLLTSMQWNLQQKHNSSGGKVRSSSGNGTNKDHSSTHHYSSASASIMVTSDNLIPALMSVIITTNPPLLFSIMQWLKSHELELLGGREAFCVTTFIAAYEQIVQLFVANQCAGMD